MLATEDRPDLNEFLTALSGFLVKKSTPKDPSYLRFLEIFCRSVGSPEGHLLKLNPAGQLESYYYFGQASQFNSDFNALKNRHQEPCPLDQALHEQKVVAIAELKPSSQVPAWFLNMMDRYDIKSMVAVPLLGQNKSVGVLCAYYHDFCVFDQGTLDRLLGIGRMVGAASENNENAPTSEGLNTQGTIIDEVLQSLTTQRFSQEKLYRVVGTAIEKILGPAQFMYGYFHPSPKGMEYLVLFDNRPDAPSNAIQFQMPPVLQKKLLKGNWTVPPHEMKKSDWGEFSALLSNPPSDVLCESLIRNAKLEGMLLAWRSSTIPFSENERLTIHRLLSIMALALNTTN